MNIIQFPEADMDYKKIGVIIADDMEFLPLKNAAETFGAKNGEMNKYETLSFSAYGKDVFAVRCMIGAADGRICQKNHRKRKTRLRTQYRSFRRNQGRKQRHGLCGNELSRVRF